ncbi:MAG: universal stress protein [Candidatus Scalindua sp. AMX11]|nr:MAG: universal stress protein [Candidatus Scalindua sp.]NOG85854.1 universal stress protein [Planctomycetota bacterium]RZV96974.1 MAG: universal stress protein [Candidatus Scalindua sp. SCAELEC01]TDE66414.1 MAG: universal stress protein [Candidatus Scalindua sp. AMX11]GJQ58195.1 MAG: universal stress protein [Candidatus Scalindua sp.]
MKILVTVDFSRASVEVLKSAKTLALALSAQVWLLHVVDQDPDFLDDEFGSKPEHDHLSWEFPQEHKALQQEVDKFQNSKIDTTPLLVQGSTVEVILEKSKILEIDIIILGSHGHGGVHHLIFGSVSEGVLRSTPCPVLVVPTHGRT